MDIERAKEILNSPIDFMGDTSHQIVMRRVAVAEIQKANLLAAGCDPANIMCRMVPGGLEMFDITKESQDEEC